MHSELIDDPVRWNTFITNAPNGHICQTYEWADQRDTATVDAPILRLGASDNGRMVGALLLVPSRMRGIRQPIYYAPRGPVVADPTTPVLPSLLNAAARLVRQQGACALRLEPNVLDGEQQWLDALRQLGYHSTDHALQPRTVWVLDIRPSEKDLLAGMHAKWRYNIGLAQRKHVTVRQGTTAADLDIFYRLHAETAHRAGFYLYPKAVFQAMMDHYSSDAAQRRHTAEMRLLIAEYAGEPLAAITIARLGKWAWYLHGGSGTKERNRMPNHLLQWTAFQWAKANGVEFYDFRGIPDILEPGQAMFGIYEFKKGFGGVARRVIPTMDYVINPLQYYPYQVGVALHHRVAAWRRARSLEHEQRVAQRDVPLIPS